MKKSTSGQDLRALRYNFKQIIYGTLHNFCPLTFFVKVLPVSKVSALGGLSMRVMSVLASTGIHGWV